MSNIQAIAQTLSLQSSKLNASDNNNSSSEFLKILGQTTIENKSENIKYDFSGMSRSEIANAGKQLFNEGKISIDELFRFDHPDGKLRVDANGNEVQFSPDERINFLYETRQAINNMELTGDSLRSDSSYNMMVGLLEKLMLFNI